jgi:chlorobactene glucosyltransferase
MMGGPWVAAATAILGAALAWAAYLLPLADLTGCARADHAGCLALAVALPGPAAVAGLHIAGSAYFRIPLWYGLLFPLDYTAGALMALDSVRRRLIGQIVWKGRVYP